MFHPAPPQARLFPEQNVLARWAQLAEP